MPDCVTHVPGILRHLCLSKGNGYGATPWPLCWLGRTARRFGCGCYWAISPRMASQTLPAMMILNAFQFRSASI